MSKNKTCTPIVSNKTLLKSYAASIEAQQATIKRLTDELFKADCVRVNLQDLVRACRRTMRELDPGGHVEQNWPDFCADTERLILAAEQKEGE